MPILLGAGVIRWSKDGTVEFGGPGDALDDDSRNLAFYRNRLVLRTSVLARPVFVTLDTGAVTTDLNANFAAEFAELIARTGTRDTQSITGENDASSRLAGRRTFL